jgi:predicted nucleic acid-binding protein
MPDSFFDSNILVYLIGGEGAKADRAEALIREGGAISVQVLNEVANVARRKMSFTWAETRDTLSTLRELLTVHPITVGLHDEGIDLAERYGLSTYDAMIVASARRAECATLWSEDMQDGLKIGTVLTIRNPFGE